jgi:site-specific DNA-methyltransferase (adenine-specific)
VRLYYETKQGRLYQGDCLEVMQKLADDGVKVDMVLTDPPYGTTACKWDSVIPLEPMWECIKRLTKEQSAIVMTASQPFTSLLGSSNIKLLRYSWVWQKSAATGHLNAKRMPMKNHEDVLVFYAKQPTYNPQGLTDFKKTVRRGGNGGCYGDSGKENFQEKTGYPRTVLKINSEGKTVHPTQKPVALMEYLIKTYTNEGDLILDFTIGSGTTAIAAERTGRKWIGIELSEEYCEVAKQRLEKEAQQ